jgi:hypothetical protein
MGMRVVIEILLQVKYIITISEIKCGNTPFELIFNYKFIKKPLQILSARAFLIEK